MQSPQVILLGADSPIGLSVIRELGRHGVAVHAVGRNARSIGLYSRYAASRHYREKDEDDLIRQLDAIGKARGCRWLMTIGETDILLLQRRAADFAYLTPIVPEAGPFSAVLDKAQTFAAAQAVGIRVPRSWALGHIDELAALEEELRFPLVLKWANPLRVNRKLAAAGRQMDKYRYIHSFTQLTGYLDGLQAVGEFPLIQEYCPGAGLGQMLFMHRGEAVQRFEHLRIAEWPPEGGVSAVCESLPPDGHSELMTQSIRLLQRLNWEGPAMVEYRYEAASGEACLMEINGRFWGSLPLAYHAGADFAWLSYQAGSGLAPAPPPPYRTGLRCRYFAPEIKRLARVLFSPHDIQDRSARFSRARELTGFAAGYFSPATRYYVFSYNDPMPFFHDLWGAFKEKVIRPD